MPYHNRKKTTEQSSHVPAMITGFSQMLRTPIISFFIIFIITFAMFLPAGFYVLKKNINALDNVWSQSAEISLYLKKQVTPKAATDLTERLKLNDAIMGLKLIASDDGIKDFAQRTGFGEILLGVKTNSLPDVIIVQPKLSQLPESQIIALIDSLKNLPEVEAAKVDMEWIGQSYRLLNLLEQLSSILALLLTVGAIVVIYCTAYVTPQIIINKIDTSKRVLQYQCFWHSLIGGLLAISLVNFILMILHNSGFVLQGLGVNYSIMFILAGVLSSMISLKLAIRKGIHSQN